jgi:hypothetical protein
MKKLILHGLAGAVVALSTTAAAVAGERDNDCSLKTLRGRYVFTARGFNIVSGVPQPKAILEIVDFNGDGTLAVPAVTVSINGAITRGLPSTGTYTVDDRCTGTISFGGPTYDFFVDQSGKEMWLIQTNPNTVFQGTATRTERGRHFD